MTRTLSIRTVLTILMVGEIVAAIGITAWLWYGNGQASINNLTRARCLEISHHIEDQILHLLTTASNTAKTQKDLIRSGIIDLNSAESIQQLLEHQMRHLKMNRWLTTVGIGFSNGLFLGAQRDPDGGLQELRSPAGEDVLHERTLGEEVPKTSNFNLLTRPWYQKATETQQSGWTGIYKFSGIPPQLGATVFEIIRGSANTVSGVALCDITLGPIDEFLRLLRMTENGRSLVLGKDGKLVATSRGHSLGSDESGKIVQLKAADCEDALIRDTFLMLETKLGEVSTWPVRGSQELTTSNGKVVSVWSPVKDAGGINLISLIIIPHDDLVTEISQRTRTTGLVFLALILATLPIVWRTAAGITRPVRELNKGMQKISRFEIDGTPGVPSRLTELNQMQQRMEGMRHALASFEKYVPSRVVRDLVQKDQIAQPGMTEATACVYFSDVVGFTGIAEQLPPEQLVKLGGEYMEAMSQQIHNQDGVLDKFIGDAIMAFWVAQVDGARVTLRACITALESQRCLARLRQDWATRSMPQLHARIGIHTGPLLVGNMGSSTRLNYTVIGDSVNLASRLEGLNRFYSTEIIVSEEVANIVSDEMHCRILDHVAVKGRRQGGSIYELVCEKSLVTPELLELAHLHQSALACYEAGEFASAAQKFESNSRRYPEDQPTKVLAQRCLEYSKSPPENWAGFIPLDLNF
ncbi:MAG: adenylate/guanylate cyclase domain-containing protein [Planctomycetota bacterium]|nr:adenylate/guanylate cyclase domain-containing protein [Planctomycetota bacterium]